MDPFRAIRGRAPFRVLAAALMLACAPFAAAQSHFPDVMFHDGLENVADGPLDANDAARFLTQATFGPTDADIAHLRAIGYQAWLNEQFAAPVSSQLAYYDYIDVTLAENAGYQTFLEGWFLSSLGGPDPQSMIPAHTDQLRQRVAFALSEILVISDLNTTLDQHPEGFAYYYDLLSQYAFGDFRVLLEKVTLSPSMGIYLNMAGNQRADLSTNRHPDENYAREINQLFSVGLVMLNQDGTPQLSGGQPIPTYSQTQITAFAHVFTGWDFPPSGQDAPNAFRNPLVADASNHDNYSDLVNDLAVKQLLQYPGAANGGIVPNLGTPQQDLTFALDNIFKHPNVGPFISKQLIQRLVTSNPTPAYVGRVAAVFNDDGTAAHKRGNLQAVVSAILLDSEARFGQFKNPTTYGKLREPLLRQAQFWRGMSALHHCGTNHAAGATTEHYANQPYRYAGYVTAWGTDDQIYGSGVGQAPLKAPSVFNFFRPGYVPPGEMAAAGMVGPEFQVHTDTLATNIINNFAGKSQYLDLTDACDANDDIGDVSLNRTKDLALAGSANGGPTDPATKLVDAYNLRFMSGQMSPYMRNVLLTDLNPIGISDGADWKMQRINRALLLIFTAPEYVIQK